ncbi:arginine--tRNA ligase [Actinotignum urinale]|uniref:arginine--tRNA ligase n=1 Tax=Actinotignum urinale TaxID=190146 RepID=UPI002A82663E|nr:arginine--tRNA ligase [Actinotignum urinale]MDY5151593.1 arginine--tRNA ligase [Actinotignum urinale]
MTPEELSELVASIIGEAKESGEIALEGDIPPVKIERPRNREHGDWACNAAMQLAKRAGMKPRELAEIIATRLQTKPSVAKVEVAGPGFINITLAAGAAGELAQTILESGRAYGTNSSGAGTTVNLEYVSANPTGPIHIGGARWAAVGDTLARVLVANGSTVVREYYFNDHGNQINNFSASLLAAAHGREIPEDGYGGTYISDIAHTVISQCEQAGEPDPRTLPDDEAQEVFRARGVELMFAEIKESLHNFRADFDVFFHEESLHASGAVSVAVEKLRERGEVFDKDGAVWLRTTDYGDDKDRVVVKSDGETAYFAGDLAYYLDKRARGADQCVYMLGADHHGYIGRMYAMARAFGDTAGVGENMEIMIGQLVNLMKGGQPVRMSKRAGTVVTLEDFVDAVGVDAARYSLVRASVDTSLDLDLDLLASHTNENPVYYVQYAHARTVNVARNANEHAVKREDAFTPELLEQADSDLLGQLARFPEVVRLAGAGREPHRVARYLEELAGAYHTWYGKARVTPRADEEVTDLHRTRLWVNDATRQVLANGLEMLGVSAPEKM